MTKLLILATLALSAAPQAPKEISADTAIATVRQFLKDSDVKGKFSLTSCRRMDYRGLPTHIVWYVRMVKNAATNYSLGLDAYGRLLWFGPEAGGSRTVPETSVDWKRRATARANELLAKLKSGREIAQPSEDLVRFSNDVVFLPIIVNGKRFVGNHLGYSFEFEPDMQLRRFERNDDVPNVSADKPVVKPEDALAEAKQSLEEDVRDQNMKGHRFTFGKETLVYYHRGDMNEARLCWYFKVQAEYDYAFSTKGGEFGVVVDALTGKRIKTPTMLS